MTKPNPHRRFTEQHGHLIGSTQSGRTGLLRSLVSAVARNPNTTWIVLDPRGSLMVNLLHEICTKGESHVPNHDDAAHSEENRVG